MTERFIYGIIREIIIVQLLSVRTMIDVGDRNNDEQKNDTPHFQVKRDNRYCLTTECKIES